MLSLSRWQRENAKKSDRDRENVRNVTDEKEAAVSHYGLFQVVILFRFKSSFFWKQSCSSPSPLFLSFK